MATFTYFPNLLDGNSVTYSFVPGSGSLTSFALVDEAGNTLTFSGDDFSFGPNGATGGMITGLVETNASGDSVIAVSRLTLTVADVMATIALAPTDEGLAFVTLLTQGRDVLKGSAGADDLIGGAKADKMSGGRGEDFFYSGAGNDTMTGGGQADTFLFDRKGDGANVITDFTDLGTRADDHIMVSKAMYRNMVVTEDATGVLLRFSASSSVHVDGWHAAQVGIDDFLLF